MQGRTACHEFERQRASVGLGYNLHERNEATDGKDLEIESSVKNFKRRNLLSSDNKRPDPRAGNTLVVIIGGCTQAEIAALRAQGVRDGVRYSILTTDIITGSDLVASYDMRWEKDFPEVGRQGRAKPKPKVRTIA